MCSATKGDKRKTLKKKKRMRLRPRGRKNSEKVSKSLGVKKIFGLSGTLEERDGGAAKQGRKRRG